MAKLYAAQAPYHLCFETLANETRIQIIKLLQEKPMSVKELVQKLNAEQSRVSHSLEMLRACNYVGFEAMGRERIYYLKEGVAEEIKASQTTAPQALKFADTHFAHYCNCECAKTKK